VLAITYVACWVLALAIAMRATRCSDIARAIVAVIASCLSIGGTVLFYAQREFSATTITTPRAARHLRPIVIAPAQLHEESTWIFPISLLILSILALMMRRVVHRSASRSRNGAIETSYPQRSSTNCG
jgi:hypothetical protein